MDCWRLPKKHPEIGDVTRAGSDDRHRAVLKMAINSKPDAKLTAGIVARARDKGLILLSCGPYYNVLRILVPLTIEDTQIRQGLEIISQCFC
ncbi:4-aminobutyrate aminotransferase [Escherichia coli]|uniref:4-aminobutyrate aminotransferase n=1 Tax=Escherichia coli TaxID=562 RepID=A0A377AJA0_ECOLX|nr:4-aminobutyrate aminotransferase [Escherichia coli]